MPKAIDTTAFGENNTHGLSTSLIFDSAGESLDHGLWHPK